MFTRSITLFLAALCLSSVAVSAGLAQSPKLVELKGVVINSDKGDMRDVYGQGVTAKAVLQENKVTAPDSVRALPSALGRYSERKAEK